MFSLTTIDRFTKSFDDHAPIRTLSVFQEFRIGIDPVEPPFFEAPEPPLGRGDADQARKHPLGRHGEGVTGIGIAGIHPGKHLIEPPPFPLIALPGIDPVPFEIDVVDEDVGPTGIDRAVFAIEETPVVVPDEFPLPPCVGIGEDFGIGFVEAMEHETGLQPLGPIEETGQFAHFGAAQPLGPFPLLITVPGAVSAGGEPAGGIGPALDNIGEHRGERLPEPHRLVFGVPDEVADPAGGELLPFVPPHQLAGLARTFVEPDAISDLSGLCIGELQLRRRKRSENEKEQQSKNRQGPVSAMKTGCRETAIGLFCR